MPVIYKKLAWLDREELIKHFVSVEFNRFLRYYENAADINVDESRHSDSDFSGRGERRERGKRRERDGRGKRDNFQGKPERGGSGKYQFSRFFFNMGKKNGISKRTIIDMVNQNLPGKNVEIGNIEVLKGFSFFEVDKRFEKEVLKSFKDAKYKGQRIGIDIAKGK
jgi:ATP-dependent RNA helicase DeaD